MAFKTWAAFERLTSADLNGNFAPLAPKTRKLWLPAQDAALDGSALALLGTVPNAIQIITLADAATQGAFWTFAMPADYDSGAGVPIAIAPHWAPAAVDAVAHTVRWSTNSIAPLTGVLSAAGTTTNFTGVSAARSTIGALQVETAVSTGLTPASSGLIVRMNLRRLGADGADTYVGIVHLAGAMIHYPAIA